MWKIFQYCLSLWANEMSCFEQNEISSPSIRIYAWYYLYRKIELYDCYTWEIKVFLSFDKCNGELVCQWSLHLSHTLVKFTDVEILELS